MLTGRNSISLLSRDVLIKTGNLDYAEWNYKPILSYLQRKRFKLCKKLLAGKQYNNLLEIGYGSGVFIPELMKYGKEIFGVDIHKKNNEVARSFLRFNNIPKLYSNDVTSMPFGNDFFDCIVSVSTIEFIDKIEDACSEIRRVLKKDGDFIVITPGYSVFVDFGLKLLTGNSAKNDYKGRREKVIPALRKYFYIKEKRNFPIIINQILPLYTALNLKPIK